ncbi:3-hydroxyalkanoate synthetase [Pokkaliibacter plantistimulans]|uniref:3-hydroxyalkanoate synthetase n=1 Tax=Pokkaliibacter plantistimulans TaxID=1635171 RepID=A0ABX5LVD1_9GAMM|nr:DUF3141 domain-containing protein [Pokkaliibacter plantistimulans]PXF28665.1 3-hydroxyalkanoate synthetase [Pokkaliibacter plantistimulans]
MLNTEGFGSLWNVWADGLSYGVDAIQRSVLFTDVLRQRGERYHQHMAMRVPHVLSFDADLVADGRELPDPAAYGLAVIVPPEGIEVDMRKRPFVVVDPRAGNSPGIGGFKSDSEIGVALRSGHPCYFIGFLTYPLEGQTIEAVIRAHHHFLEVVRARHPEAEGKPVVVGNCQAGWQVMIAAALRPELFGPLIIAGTPLSYWAGVRGQNPMRYSGGLLGGSWMTALTSDLGKGVFDGAWLVQNFESLNPANTLWTKQYHLYSNIDTEPARYLEFEKWWGGHVYLNGGEMQYIVDNLFIGNRLTANQMVMADGTRVDLRNIRSPIIVFCSKGDNISPPQQALGWISDLYDSGTDVQARGQTIIYAIHDSIGHLGIFVSGKIARKEHNEFASNIDFIDVMPPGLYEAIITPKAADATNAELAHGDYILEFAGRGMDDIRAVVQEREDDNRRFAAVDRLSQINLGLYRQFMQPWVRAISNDVSATVMHRLHPLRVSYEMFSEINPWMTPVRWMASFIDGNRLATTEDNIFTQIERQMSGWLESALDRYRDNRDMLKEQIFLAFYGSPLLQAMLGLSASDAEVRPHPGADPEFRAYLDFHHKTLRQHMTIGGIREAMTRSLIYVALATRVTDERSFHVLQQFREAHAERLSLHDFKALLRDQFLMLRLDEPLAVASIPSLLQGVPAATIEETLALVHSTLTAPGPLPAEAQVRYDEIVALFKGVISEQVAKAEATAAKAEPVINGKSRPVLERSDAVLAESHPAVVEVKADDAVAKVSDDSVAAGQEQAGVAAEVIAQPVQTSAAAEAAPAPRRASTARKPKATRAAKTTASSNTKTTAARKAPVASKTSTAGSRRKPATTTTKTPAANAGKGEESGS